MRDGGDARGYAQTHGRQLAQLFHQVVDLPRVRSFWVQNGLGVVEDYNHLLRSQEWTQGCQIVRIIDVRASGLGEPVEEMAERRRGFVNSDEPMILAKPLLDAIVMEDGQSDEHLADPANTDRSDRGETFRKSDDLVDQIVATETGFRRWRR